jgi:hypothetical protein
VFATPMRAFIERVGKDEPKLAELHSSNRSGSTGRARFDHGRCKHTHSFRRATDGYRVGAEFHVLLEHVGKGRG